MGDLWRFTPWASTWTDLSGASPLHDPGARAYHGLVSAGQTVYLFGGSSEQGEGGSSVVQRNRHQSAMHATLHAS